MTEPINLKDWRARHIGMVLCSFQEPTITLGILPVWKDRGDWCLIDVDLPVRRNVLDVLLRRGWAQELSR